jgi:hypothetical protein
MEHNMRNLVAITLLLASCALPALAQNGQLLGGAPAPPTVMPGPTIPPDYAPPGLVTVPNRPPIAVPGGPAGFSDKVQRCLQAGAAAGLGPNENSEFSRRCVN